MDEWTFQEYVAEVERAIHETVWRKGQAYFNVLCWIRPDLSEQIRGTELDPFYMRDGDLADFLVFVEEEW